MAREGGMASASELAGNRPKSRSVKSLSRLRPFLRPYITMILAATLVLVIAAGLTLAVPVALRRIVDLGFDSVNADVINQYFIAMILLATGLGIATALRFYLVSKIGERVVADLRTSVYTRIIHMSPAFFENLQTGEVLSRLTTDTTVIQSVIGSSISIALRNVLLLVGGMSMLFITSPKLTAFVLLAVPVVIVPIIYLGRKVRGQSRTSQDKLAQTSAIANETLGAVQTIQAFTAEHFTIKRFRTGVEQAFDAAHERIKTRSLLTAVVIFVIFSAIVIVLWIGARDVMAGNMTAGELTQFVLYSGFVAGAVGALSEVWGALQHAAGATQRLVELLEADDPVPLPLPLPLPSKNTKVDISPKPVIFENVSFFYSSRPDTRVLDDISFRIESGETVAIVGPSGAGKSTIFQLLLRFYLPQTGRIRLGDQSVETMMPETVRKHFALVPQEPAILADTAAANIALGIQAADTDIQTAAQAGAISTFIEELPAQYDTYVGERGIMLSGGQKQRIAIARALLRDAPVLLLDEATSALDSESERAVQQAFLTAASTRTCLVIAHRLSTVQSADRILVLENGKLVAEGTHDSLMAENGLYTRLAKLQFSAG